MKVLFAATLAALCLVACRQSPRIGRERFAREATTDLTGISTDQRALWTRPAPPPVCEIGAKKYCFGTPSALPAPLGSPYPAAPLYIRCVADRKGVAYWNNAECDTPLVVAFDAEPVAFTQSNAAFTIGLDDRTEWVSAKTPWVALDRDGSGCIESERELFAGFEALAELDANGDGRIDAGDPAFAELVLWSDRDQDKRCTPNELAPLSGRLDFLSLAYLRHEAPDTGSYEGETASLPNGARIVDVHLAALR